MCCIEPLTPRENEERTISIIIVFPCCTYVSSVMRSSWHCNTSGFNISFTKTPQKLIQNFLFRSRLSLDRCLSQAREECASIYRQNAWPYLVISLFATNCQRLFVWCCFVVVYYIADKMHLSPVWNHALKSILHETKEITAPYGNKNTYVPHSGCSHGPAFDIRWS